MDNFLFSKRYGVSQKTEIGLKNVRETIFEPIAVSLILLFIFNSIDPFVSFFTGAISFNGVNEFLIVYFLTLLQNFLPLLRKETKSVV